MVRRNTIQKELVLKAVRELRRHVTADEVYQHISVEHPSVGKGTVYRNLNILSEEGEIKKIEIPNASDRFDFTLHEHYHVRCINCGAVEDVEMSEVPDLKNQIRNSHNMKLLDYDILFRGICGACCEQYEKEVEIG